jgi:hypothetical protein
MHNADFRAVAEGLAEKIVLESDGQIDPGQWRVLSRLGARRETALGGEGVDETLDLDPASDLAEQIESFAIERARSHHEGPETYMFLVLRRHGKPGNVAVSPALRVGGGDGDAHGKLASTKHDAIAALAGMAPATLQLMERITVRALTFAENSRADEMQAKVLMAQLVGRAEAGDENARWEAGAQAAQSLAPVLSEAVAAWRASIQTSSAAPQDGQSAINAFNSWPQAAKDALIGAIKEALAAEQDGAAGASEASP